MRWGLAFAVGVVITGSAVSGLRAAPADTRIVGAVRRGDIAGVKALLRAGAEVDGAEPDGSTGLMWAAYRSDIEMARTLIAAKANPNVTNRYGLTPLLQAARVGSFPIIEALVGAGAKLDVSQPEGETPLMAVAAAGSVEAVRFLLARGAAIDARESAGGQTALMWASGEGHDDVVRALLEAGADPNVVGRVTVLPRLRGDGGRMWVDYTSGGLTAAMFAARGGHSEVLALLAAGGADLNRANPDGLTPLLIAVINDRADAAMTLLDKGADPNDGSMLEVVNLHNLRTNETVGEATRPRPWNVNKTTPIVLLEHMLNKGGDPMKVATHTLHADATGQPQAANLSAFARALQVQDIEALRAMVKKADVNLVSPAGTPLMTLMAGGGRFGGGFGAAPAAFRFPGVRSAPEAAKLLVAAGANVNARRQNGDTALHLAAAAGNVAMIQFLVDNGAALDVRNEAGFTPLDAAMGRQAPGAAAGPPQGGGGPPGRGGPPQPQPQAIALLRKLMGLPPAEATPASVEPAGRGGAGAR